MQLIATYATDMYSYLSKGSSEIQIFNFGFLLGEMYIYIYGIESRWGRDFPPVQTGPAAHPVSCTMGTGSFPGLKCSRGVLLTTHPLLVLRSWKRTAIPLPTLWATPGL